MIEPLENRKLLSAVLTSKGTFSVVGTADDDQIRFAYDTNRQRVTVAVITGDAAGESESFSLKGIKRIYVEAAGGDDLIDARDLPVKPLVLLGGSGNDKIVAGRGEAQIVGGSGNDELYSLTSAGSSTSATLIGSAGNDTLTGASKIDEYSGGSGEDLAQDQVISRDSIRGKIARQIEANIGSRGSSLEGFDLAQSAEDENNGNPLQVPSPPLFGGGATTPGSNTGNSNTGGSGSIFEPPPPIIGGGSGSIFG